MKLKSIVNVLKPNKRHIVIILSVHNVFLIT